MKFFGWILLGIVFVACVGAPARAARAIAGPARTYTAEALRGRIVGAMPPHATIKVHVVLRGRHENELDAFVRMQSEAGSPAFERYLSPQEFGAYFGADPATYAHAVATLHASGFTIDKLAENRRDIVAEAPAAVVSAFFATPIDLHVDRDRIFYAARYVPVIPVALHAELVTGLDDFHVLHSQMRARPSGIIGGYFSWTPQDVALAYDLDSLYSSHLTGAGITIANATSGAASPADLKKFQATFQLKSPAAKLVSTPIDGALSTQGNGESTLDVDWATATARGATFHQVVAHSPTNNEFDDVYEYIVDDLGSTVHVVTTSWGSCEQDSSRSEMSLDNGYFKQAAAEGQWWFSAAGDNGTDDCEDGHTKAPSVDFPGSSPYVVSVGGTDVHADINGAHKITEYVSESAWAYGNCGYSGGGSNGAGGGGKSVVYAKPSYQTALTPNDGARDVPDVSLLADDVNDGLFIVQNGRVSSGNGGTSEAAPQWAGLLAIVEQKKGGYQRVADPHVRLYQLAAPSRRATYFHDVVGGNNGVPACADDIAVFQGFNAVAGYNLASGIGSYIGAALVNGY